MKYICRVQKHTIIHEDASWINTDLEKKKDKGVDDSPGLDAVAKACIILQYISASSSVHMPRRDP